MTDDKLNSIISAMNILISHCNDYLKNAKCEGCPFDGAVCGLARIPSGWEIPEVKK